MPSPDPVRLGILSTAAINDLVLAGIEGSQSVRAYAVGSRSQATADAYAQPRGLRAHGSYDALLADPDVEAVYVSLPNALHVEWTIRALEAGKHVLCEKPLGKRFDEVERAVECAASRGLVLMEAFMYRHHPQTKRFAELAATAIGTLRTVRVALGGTQDDPANVRLRVDLDGGAFMDVGCYCVNAIRMLAGEPDTVVGTRIVGPTGTDVRFAGLMTLPENVLATFDCGFDLAPTSFIEAVGSTGVVRARDAFLLHDSAIELEHNGKVTEVIEIPATSSYGLEVENFAAAIRGVTRPLLDSAETLGQARVLDALHRSADQGAAPIRLA